eukprot:4240_1
MAAYLNGILITTWFNYLLLEYSHSQNCCPPSSGDILGTISCFNGNPSSIYTSNVNPSSMGNAFFELTIYQTQTIEFSTCDTDFDTTTKVWDASTNTKISGSYCESHDDCGACNFNERFTMPLLPGTYWIQVSAYDPSNEGNTGYLSLTVTGCTSSNPTKTPTNNPIKNPTKYPTKYPTITPTKQPSISPSDYITTSPTKTPTYIPTIS